MNSMFARYGLVTGLVDDGKTLLFTISEHCFAKKELKRSALLLKPEKKMLSRKLVGCKDLFCHLTFGAIALEHNFFEIFS